MKEEKIQMSFELFKRLAAERSVDYIQRHDSRVSTDPQFIMQLIDWETSQTRFEITKLQLLI